MQTLQKKVFAKKFMKKIRISNLNANFVTKSFLKKVTKKRHVASVHERNKLLECKLCEEKLSEKCHLNAHLPVHEKLVKFVFINLLKRNTLF